MKTIGRTSYLSRFVVPALAKSWLSLLVASASLVFTASVSALPPGFQDEGLFQGLNQSVYIAQIPDGRMLILEKDGRILIFDPSVQTPTTSTYLTLTDLNTGGERGLTSLAVHPDFAQNPYIYIYYTHGSSARNRISRFEHIGNTADPLSETLIWEDNEDWESCCHFGGGIGFGPDGKLYLTTGEEFGGAQAQDLTRAGGKIIRINDDGSIPTDNPFVDGPGGNLDEIWAYGLRNPYRATWDSLLGNFYIGEVGGNNQATASEDIHLGRKGANYGWPNCEGQCTNPAYDDPIYDYDHSGVNPAGGAVTLGVRYWGNAFPTEYIGALFYSDYVAGFIKYLKFAPDGSVDSSTDFADGLGAIVHLISGQDGSLYYVDYFGNVRRIVYNSNNNMPPVINSVSVESAPGVAPAETSFSATATDPEQQGLTYHWFFGDGTDMLGQSVDHTYAQNGAYSVRVLVSDGTLSTTSDVYTVQVGNIPVPTIQNPADGLLFRAGDTVSFLGTATDPDETLGETAFFWDVEFAHNAHVHPTLSGFNASFGSIQIEDSGHDWHDNTGYVLTLTVVDSDGLMATDSVTVLPEKVDISFQSSPIQTPIFVDGLPISGAAPYDTLVGFRHTVSVPGDICSGELQYQFDSWSDQGAMTHEYVVPAQNATLTANFVATGPCTIPQTGLVLHLEGDNGVTTGAGTTVVTWSDQTTQGNDLTAAGDPQLVSGALNGKPVIDFDGAGDKLQRIGNLSGLPAGNEDRTVVLLANYESGGFGGFGYGKNSCSQMFGTVVNLTGELTVQGWCQDFHTGVQGSGAGWLTQSAVLSSGQLTHYKDNAQIDSVTHTFNTVLTRMVLGAELDSSPFLDMQVAAVLVYDRALSPAERAQVDTYLQEKYLSGNGNQLPNAVNDADAVNWNQAVITDVVFNDTDADGTIDVTTVAIVGQPSHGTTNVDPVTGFVTYTHNGVSGAIDSYTYQVSDNEGAPSNLATVALTINGAPNQPPDAQNDADMTIEGGSVTTNVLANDTDVDGTIDATTVFVTQLPSNGSTSVDPVTGAVTYTHDGGSSTQDSYQYEVMDDDQATSNTATVTLTVSSGGLPSGGLVVHLEGDSGVTTGAGTTVLSWSDQTAQGNNLSASGDPQLLAGVLNGQPVIDFDGSGDKLERVGNLSGLPAGNADRTVVLLANYESGGFGGFGYGRNKCSQMFGTVVNLTGELTVQGWCQDFQTGTQGSGAGWLTQSAVLSSGQLTHYKDNVQIDSLTHTFNTVLTRMVLGAELDSTPFLDMQVAAVLVYDRALTPVERAQVDSYLQDKYFSGNGNQLPNAVNDADAVNWNQPVITDVVFNDTDADGTIDATTVTVVGVPSHGTTSVDPVTGFITYMHNGVSGVSDSYTYRVADDMGALSNLATVTLSISGAPNQPPAAQDDADTTITGQPVTTDVLANDTDVDGTVDATTVLVTQLPANGSTSVDPVTGAVTYTHDGGLTTQDSYQYEVMDDDQATSNTATVTLSISSAPNQPPTAQDDADTTIAGQPVTTDVLANDTDVDGTVDETTVLVTQLPANGTTSVDPVTGAVTYTHDGGSTTQDSYQYEVMDDDQATSNTATVTLSISSAPNQPPAAQDDADTTITGQPVTTDVLANDTDVDGTVDATTVLVTQLPANGSTSVDPVTGAVTYTHDGGLTTQDSYQYEVMDDDQATSNTATVTVTISPVGLPSGGLVVHLESDSGVTTGAGTTVLSWSDQTAQGNNLSASGDPQLLAGVLNGQPVIDFDGSGDKLERVGNLSGLPAGNADRTVVLLANYESGGFGGFGYGRNKCSQMFGTVVNLTGELTVQGWCQDFQTGTQGSGAGWLTQSAVLSSGQLTHYKDNVQIDSLTHTFNTVLTRMVLGAELDSSPFLDMQVAAVLVYDRALTPAERAQVDGYLQDKYFSGTGNSPPNAVNDADAVNWGQFVVTDVISNDTDANGTVDETTVAVVDTPSHGTTSVDPVTGFVTYTHNALSGAIDSYTYRVSDDEGASSNLATVTVSISGAPNQPPAAQDDVDTTVAGQPVTTDVLANDTDVDGTVDATTVVVTQLPGNGTASVDPVTGAVTYTHDGGLTTQDSYQYEVMDDDQATSNTATVTITISPVGLPLTGLVVHLEGDSGVTTGAGSTVVSWSDQTAQGNNLSASGDPQLLAGVLNGQPVIDFDGTGDKLERVGNLSGLPAGNADRTVVLLANYESGGFGGFGYGRNKCSQMFGTVVNLTGELTVQGWCQDFQTGTQGSGAGWLIQSAVLSSGQLTHYKDNVQIDSLTHTFNTVLTRMVLGAELDSTPFLDMQVAAVLVYDRALTSAERAQLDTYLQDKYGI